LSGFDAQEEAHQVKPAPAVPRATCLLALDLSSIVLEVYNLDRINEAVAHSGIRPGGFNHVVVVPNDS
jgi:hypothetical protein